MNILVTGCNGQLGNEMQLLEKENPQHTYFNTDVAELDITNQEAIEQFVARSFVLSSILLLLLISLLLSRSVVDG